MVRRKQEISKYVSFEAPISQILWALKNGGNWLQEPIVTVSFPVVLEEKFGKEAERVGPVLAMFVLT